MITHISKRILWIFVHCRINSACAIWKMIDDISDDCVIGVFGFLDMWVHTVSQCFMLVKLNIRLQILQEWFGRNVLREQTNVRTKNEAVELAIAEVNSSFVGYRLKKTWLLYATSFQNQSGHAFQLFQVFNGVYYFYSLKNNESSTCKDPTCLYCDNPKTETKTETMMQCGDDNSSDLFHVRNYLF